MYSRIIYFKYIIYIQIDRDKGRLEVGSSVSNLQSRTYNSETFEDFSIGSNRHK